MLQGLFMPHLPCQGCSRHLKTKSFNPHNNLLSPTFWMWEERSNLPEPTGLVSRAQPGRELQRPSLRSASPAVRGVLNLQLHLKTRPLAGCSAAWQHSHTQLSGRPLPPSRSPPHRLGLCREPATRCCCSRLPSHGHLPCPLVPTGLLWANAGDTPP